MPSPRNSVWVLVNEKYMEKSNYFNDIISNDEHFYDMPDCISGCSDYKDLLGKSFDLTNGQLHLGAFECSDTGDEFHFKLKVNMHLHKMSVLKVSDYVDAKGLILGLNKILESNKIESNKKFVDLVGGPVDFGVAYISLEKELELAQNGMIWRDDQFYLDAAEYQKSNSDSTVLELVTAKPRSSKKPWWKFW